MSFKDPPLLGHHAVLSSDGRAKTSPPANRRLVFTVQLLCMTVGLWNVSGIASRIWAAPITRVSRTTMCPQQNEIYPRSNLSVKINDLYNSDGFRVRAVQWLSGAIKVPFVLCVNCDRRFLLIPPSVPKAMTKWGQWA
jgi:hypothetical protein